MKDLHEIAGRSRRSFYQISVSSIESRNTALLRLAELLVKEKKIFLMQTKKIML